MNRRYYIAAVLLAALSCLFSPVTQAQPSRTLSVRLDTVRLNVCEAKNFLMSVSIGDISRQDSLVGVNVILAWDLASIDFEDVLIASSETLASQFSERMLTKDRERGMMFIEMGNYDLRPVAGTGRPLFFLKGTVTAPDTVAGQNGWVQVLNMTFESSTHFQTDLTGAGLVRVVRDTTPGFTGHLSPTVAAFDTLRADTVTLAIQNVRNRRVREVAFRIEGDTRYYNFVDTIETGTLAGTLNWTTKELTIVPDAVEGRFVSDADLTEEGGLIKIVLHRTNDSAFSTDLAVERFTVNRESCLGKLVSQDAPVSAAAVPVHDTASSVADQAWRVALESVRVIPGPQGGTVTIITGDLDVMDVAIFDMYGNGVPVRSADRLNASTRVVRFEIPPPSGTYFVALRDRNNTAYKQFTIIK